jgi:hypothetical protein
MHHPGTEKQAVVQCHPVDGVAVAAFLSVVKVSEKSESAVSKGPTPLVKGLRAAR